MLNVFTEFRVFLCSLGSIDPGANIQQLNFSTVDQTG